MLQRGKIHYLGAETVFDMLLKLCLRCLKRLFVSAPSPLTLCCGSDVSVTVHCAGKQCSGCYAVTSMNYAHVQWSSESNTQVLLQLSVGETEFSSLHVRATEGVAVKKRTCKHTGPEACLRRARGASALQIITVQLREKWPLTICRLDRIKQPEATSDVLVAKPSCVADRICSSFSSFQGRYCGNPPKTESNRLQSRSSASLCRLTTISWLTGNTECEKWWQESRTVCTHHRSVTMMMMTCLLLLKKTCNSEHLYSWAGSMQVRWCCNVLAGKHAKIGEEWWR